MKEHTKTIHLFLYASEEKEHYGNNIQHKKIFALKTDSAFNPCFPVISQAHSHT